MKRSLLFLILTSIFSPLAAQHYSVSGGNGVPLLADSIPNYLEVYVLNGLSGALISYPSSGQWYRYTNNANNATPVASVQNGNTSTISGADIRDGCGYFVGSPTDPKTHYVWIIDYSRHIPHLSVPQIRDDEYKCTTLTLLTTGNINTEPIAYYSPTGVPKELYRIFRLQYDSLFWGEDSKQFSLITGNKEIRGPFSAITVEPPPLTDTRFTLTGDQFAEHFGLQQSGVSEEYKAVAVEAHATAETNRTFADNEIHNSGDALGGSAPIDYTFTAYANEPVAALYIWKILQQDSVTKAYTQIVRYTDKVLQYTFDKNGTYKVALEVDDAQLVCVDTTQVFNIVIDNTVMKIPNVFTPGSSIGSNDILKVAFTSVTAFKASVFNRWGNLLFQWTDPSKGWDGRVSGKYAPTGVYYVIVEYKDSNGKNRTMSRAVNLLRATDAVLNQQ